MVAPRIMLLDCIDDQDEIAATCQHHRPRLVVESADHRMAAEMQHGRQLAGRQRIGIIDRSAGPAVGQHLVGNLPRLIAILFKLAELPYRHFTERSQTLQPH